MGIDLAHGKSGMSPKEYLYFQQEDHTIQDHIARLIANIREKNSIDSKTFALFAKGILECVKVDIANAGLNWRRMVQIYVLVGLVRLALVEFVNPVMIGYV